MSSCPFTQCVLRALTAYGPSPRRTFSPLVTASIWLGLMQAGILHRWSITKPSGIGPRISS